MATTLQSSQFLQYAEQAASLELEENDQLITKRQLWEKMGNELEVQGYPKDMISKAIRSIIEEKLEKKLGEPVSINTAHYYTTMKKNNWNDKSLARNTNISATEIKNTSLYTKENQKLIDQLYKTITLCKTIISYAQNNAFLSLLPKDIIEDILTRMDSTVQYTMDCMNKKQTIPMNGQLIFLLLHNLSSDINNTFSLYHTEVKEQQLTSRIKTKKTNQILTSKEVRKLQNKELVRLSNILECTSQNEARLNGFYGQQCPNCKGFRTKITDENPSKVYCVKCHNLKGMDAFPREHYITCQQCRYIMNNTEIKGKCPHCGLSTILPTELKN